MHPALDLANPFKTSPAPSSGSHNSGEAEPSVTPAYGAGVPATASQTPCADGVVAGSIPAGYVLVPIDELKCWRDDLAYYRAREQRVERGAA